MCERYTSQKRDVTFLKQVFYRKKEKVRDFSTCVCYNHLRAYDKIRRKFTRKKVK